MMVCSSGTRMDRHAVDIEDIATINCPGAPRHEDGRYEVFILRRYTGDIVDMGLFDTHAEAIKYFAELVEKVNTLGQSEQEE